MNEISLDTRELVTLEKDLRDFAAKAGPAVNRAIAQSTDYLAALAESSAAVLSGDLRDSIKRDRSGAGKNQARRVYADDPAAMANEYGTSRMAPQPFLMIHHPAALGALEAAIGEEIDRLKL